MGGDAERNPGEINRLAYQPMHDYRTVDVDAWAEQWFSGFSSLDPDNEDYQTTETIIHRQLHLHPNYRESDANDLGFGLDVLRAVGSQNPYDPTSESVDELTRHRQWEELHPIHCLIARQIVRVTLDDAETYAAFRVEQEKAGRDHLTGMLNRRGLARMLSERYGITDDQVRRDPSGVPLQPIKLTHFYNDANKFRWLNNNLGHQVGDAAIIEIAWRGREFFRQAEVPILYRAGGDEFGAIVAELSDEDIGQIKRRLIGRLIGRVASARYREAMASVVERLRMVQESGQMVRAEARPVEPGRAGLATGKRPDYELYINGQPVTALGEIISIAAGMATGMASNLDDVERLRRESEAAMNQIKPVLHAIIEGEIIVVPPSD